MNRRIPFLLKASILVLVTSLSLVSFCQPVIELIDHTGKPVVIDTRQQPVGPEAARSIVRTIELMLPLAAEEVEKLEEEKKALSKDLGAHEKKGDLYTTEKATLDKGWTTYGLNKDPYDQELTSYKAAVTAYKDNPTDAELARLKNWKKDLDVKMKPLVTSFQKLDAKEKELAQRKSDLASENSALQIRSKNINARLGKAYRQLEALNKHALAMNKYLVANNWKVTPIDQVVLSGSFETLKEAAALGFDGNAEAKKLDKIRKNFTATPN
jgi:chromosome segregation ATPase